MNMMIYVTAHTVIMYRINKAFRFYISSLSYFGHTMRYDSLNKTVIQGCVFGKRRRGLFRKNWMDNIVEWAGS